VVAAQFDLINHMHSDDRTPPTDAEVEREVEKQIGMMASGRGKTVEETSS